MRDGSEDAARHRTAHAQPEPCAAGAANHVTHALETAPLNTTRQPCRQHASDQKPSTHKHKAVLVLSPVRPCGRPALRPARGRYSILLYMPTRTVYVVFSSRESVRGYLVLFGSRVNRQDAPAICSHLTFIICSATDARGRLRRLPCRCHQLHLAQWTSAAWSPDAEQIPTLVRQMVAAAEKRAADDRGASSLLPAQRRVPLAWWSLPLVRRRRHSLVLPSLPPVLQSLPLVLPSLPLVLPSLPLVLLSLPPALPSRLLALPSLPPVWLSLPPFSLSPFVRLPPPCAEATSVRLTGGSVVADRQKAHSPPKGRCQAIVPGRGAPLLVHREAVQPLRSREDSSECPTKSSAPK